MKDGVEPKLPTPPPLDDSISPEEAARRKALEYGEDDDARLRSDDELGEGEQEAITTTHEERIAQVPLVNYSVPAGGKVWHAKLPNFLRLETTAWSQDHWQPEEEEQGQVEDSQEGQNQSQGGDETKPKIGRNKSHLPDENVIRWRWTKDELGEYVSTLHYLASLSSNERLNVPPCTVDQTI
jgi:RNA polymerase-associated protein LEO1